MNITELTERYFKEGFCQKKPETITANQERLKPFLKFLEENNAKYLAEISSCIFRSYAENLKDTGRSNNTRYVYLEAAKKFFIWLYEGNYLLTDISREILLPKWERKAKKIYAKSEIRNIIEKILDSEPIKSRNQAIAALKLYENLKPADIFQLSALDISLSFEASEIRLVRLKRFLKIQAETAQYLKQYLKKRILFKPKTDYLFVGRTGEKLDIQSIGLAIRGIKTHP